MSQIIRSADSKANPDGYVTGARYASLQLDNATGIVLTTPTVATTLADAANGWTAGLASTINDGLDPSVSATAGTITIKKAAVYRVTYSGSGITAVNTANSTMEVYVNAVASKGKVAWTGLTGAPFAGSGMVLLSLVVGDVITIKASASTGNFTMKQGSFLVEEI